MKLFEWKDKYSVKIKSIDEQHKKFIGIINNFYANLKVKSSDELISELIREMKDYSLVHFETEEKYFKQYDYPDYETHKKEHTSFIEKVTDVEKRFNEGKLVLSLEITGYLKDWLSDHVLGTDMKYSDFLVQRGVK